MTLTCEIRFFGLKNAEKTEAGGRGGGRDRRRQKKKKGPGAMVADDKAIKDNAS